MSRFFGFFLLAAVVAGWGLGGSGCGEEPDPRARLIISGPESLEVKLAGKSYQPPFRFTLPAGTYLCKFSAPGFVDRWEAVTLKQREIRTLEAKLEPISTAVLIATRPAGAKLTIDGRVIGTTPLVLEKVGVGTYSGQLSMPGYSERAVSWTVSDARPQKVVIDLNSNVGMLEIGSIPDKARVLIDGREVGVTPYRGEFREGKYQVRLEQEGCVPVEQSVVLSRGEEFKRVFKLTVRPGGIDIVTEPAGAEIFVNNTKRGISPCTLSDLEPAIYEVRAVKEGFDPAVKTVEIAPGFRDNIRLELLRSTGSLEFSVRPSGVKVLFDGEELGITRSKEKGGTETEPFRLEAVSPGAHRITVTHPRANPVTRDYQVTIEKGETLTLAKPIDVWIANCEIRYRSGAVETGAIYEQNEREIFFGPEPGVKIGIERSLLDSIKIIPSDEL